MQRYADINIGTMLEILEAEYRWTDKREDSWKRIEYKTIPGNNRLIEWFWTGSEIKKTETIMDENEDAFGNAIVFMQWIYIIKFDDEVETNG